MVGKIDMHSLSPSYRKVLIRIKSFIRRYYLNRIIHGLIVSLVFGSFFLLVLILVNEITLSPASFREPAFKIGAFVSLGFLIVFVLIPAFRLLGLMRGMNIKAAERLIRNKFPELNDTLLNLIELGENDLGEKDSSLIFASIEERENRLKWYKFEQAVPYKKLIKPAAYFISVVVLGLLLLSIWPNLVKTGYSRTVHYKQEFDTKIKLQLLIVNDSLRVGLGSDLEILVSSNIPLGDADVYINIGASLYQMKTDGSLFSHTVEAINGDFDFSVKHIEFESKRYHVEVIPIPEMHKMEIVVIPPRHTGLELRLQNNSGDLLIAEGSVVNWSIMQQHADIVSLIFNDDSLYSDQEEGIHKFSKIIKLNLEYELFLKSLKLREPVSFRYNIEVIKDQFPGIIAKQVIDSVFAQQVYIQANIQDDYGFSNLIFYIVSAEEGLLIYQDTIKVLSDANFQKVYYAVDFKNVVAPGKDYEYFLSVWDNDGVNGPKRTDSKKFRMRVETTEELWDSNREKGADLGNKIEDSKDLTNKLREKLNELIQSQLIENKDDWEIKSKVDEISEMKDLLQEMIENIQLDNRMMNLSEQFSSERRDEILRKQEEIEELFEKLLDDELKKLFEEFEKLAEEMSQRERLEKTEELKMNLENLEEQLDVNLELLRKLELEKQIYDLANKMKKLGKEVKEKQDSTEIEKAKEDFEKLEEKLDEQLKKNSELNKPHELNSFKEERKDIKDELNDAAGSKDEEKKKESMQDAGEKMEELGQKMQDMMTQSGQGGNSVDLELLRQLARELNDFSFRQEELLSIIGAVSARNKVFHEVGVEQLNMEMKFDIIKDSLRSLGYKQPLIAGLLNQEVFHVETSLRNLFRSVQDGKVSQVRYEQQKVMEGVNELAVRLDELVENIQSMSGQGEGAQSFTDSKPKDGAEKMGDMREQQQSLKEQMKGMIQKMKEGKKGSGGNKELARMLAEREMLRQQLEQLRNSGLLGDKAKQKLDGVQDMMENVEKDIIYNRVSDHTISKEEWIQTRLLEAETAEREREKENKREATEFRGGFDPIDIPAWKEIEEEQKQQIDLMKYNEFKLKEYYRIKYQKYLKKIKKLEK